MNAPKEAYPLTWPVGRPRTLAGKRERAKFSKRERRESGDSSWTVGRYITLAEGRDRLLRELGLFGARGIVISTNVELRQDGLPYSNRRPPDDPGVAVYFTLNSQPRVISCDGWDRVADNLAAIAATVGAKRGVTRWKTETADQAFAGFAALPPLEPKKPWWEILQLAPKASAGDIEARRRALLVQHHPDRGGSASVAAEINAAADEGVQEARP